MLRLCEYFLRAMVSLLFTPSACGTSIDDWRATLIVGEAETAGHNGKTVQRRTLDISG
jgi:hypothetical protein